MIPAATEALRYEYPLTEQDVVIDAGGFEGDFAKTIADRYDCHVHVFEPVMRFANGIRNRLRAYPKVHVWPSALGGADRIATVHVQNNSSGIFAGSPDTEDVHVMAIENFLAMQGGEFALLKLNVEGMEFEILEAIILLGAVSRFRDIQCQFHTCAPDWQHRYPAIALMLSKTHRLTYQTPWVWENWARL